MNVSNILFLLGIVVVHRGESANIFCVFPTPSYSHQQPLLRLSHALAARGHNLTVLTTNPSKKPIPNHNEIDISESYKMFDKKVHSTEVGAGMQGKASSYRMLYEVTVWIEQITKYVLQQTKVQQLIKDIKGTQYDLIIYEALNYNSLLGFRELIGNPPSVGLLTLSPSYMLDKESGNPINPSYVPSLYHAHGNRMTFWERAVNLFSILREHYLTETVINPEQERLLKKYFPDSKQTAEELNRNRSLLIVSQDLTGIYPKPNQPNTVYVGSMHIQDNPQMPQDIKKWMDEAEDGVIYFSLGSSMKGTSLPEDKRLAFIKTFSQFPKIRVLWKWESDNDLPGRLDNILVKKWLPQQAILAHPKVRLFITQVGMQSFQEAVHYGVPMLGCPVFADQNYNARKLAQSGAGLSIELGDSSFELIYSNVERILTNTSFKQNALRLQAIAKDKPMPPVETAVWWVEYVLRHQGAPHLRPASLDLTWYQYFLLDVIGAFLFALFIAVYITHSVLKAITRSFTNNKVKTS